MTDTETSDGQCWPPRPDTPEGRAQIRICALDMAIRCRRDEYEASGETVQRAEQFSTFLAGDAP